ncbi:MAG: hypothetical protein RIS29_3048 [Bacteroidota bacterium]|jgi:hypothetical protein
MTQDCHQAGKNKNIETLRLNTESFFLNEIKLHILDGFVIRYTLLVALTLPL